eukprot:364177-Chlamydomonas_euryale.AAC.5
MLHICCRKCECIGVESSRGCKGCCEPGEWCGGCQSCGRCEQCGMCECPPPFALSHPHTSGCDSSCRADSSAPSASDVQWQRSRKKRRRAPSRSACARCAIVIAGRAPTPAGAPPTLWGSPAPGGVEATTKSTRSCSTCAAEGVDDAWKCGMICWGRHAQAPARQEGVDDV